MKRAVTEVLILVALTLGFAALLLGIFALAIWLGPGAVSVR